MTHEEIFNFSPIELPKCEEGFVFACVGLAHSHIYGMTNGLISAGATPKWVWDDDSALVDAFVKKYPSVKVAQSIEEVLGDGEVELIASADIPSRRGDLAVRSMRSGHHFFVDKAPVITLFQLDEVIKAKNETGKKYFVYYSEFIESECTMFAKELVDRGVIGKLVHMDIFAPHSLYSKSRAPWFWKREATGGIINDIGSHQIEQFLEFFNLDDAKIDSARVDNICHPQYPEFDDIGDVTLSAPDGSTAYVRIDWNSPAGLKVFGDLRLFLIGEKGYIELRKNCDVGNEGKGNNVIVVTDEGVFRDSVTGKIGKPYFRRLINDCRTGSDSAMNVKRVLSTARLAVEAQELALSKLHI